MNIADSDMFSRILQKCGFESSINPENSDLILINTCVVRAKAQDKAISYLGEIENLRKLNPNLRVILAGCLAPLSDELELKRRFPSILFSIKPEKIDDFESMLRESFELDPTDFDNQAGSEFSDDVTHLVDFPSHAFVNVMRGCEQYCTYCIVPKTRGKNHSREFDEIADEIRLRISCGAKAITLLGQSILDYGKDWHEGKNVKTIKGDESFRELLDKISDEFPGTWIKFLTSHPKDLTFETVDLIASRENISKFIHLPVQAGDDEILKRMNRGHNREYYLKLADYIYDKIPDVRMSSDIIVGFPGEDFNAFEQSLDLLRKVRFHKVFTFQYSTRPGTPAENFADDLPFDEKRRRLNILIEMQNQITIERHRELEGTEMDVIVECEAKKQDGFLLGRSLSEDIVIFKNPDNINPGDIVRVRITEGHLRTLVGEKVD